jgi:hypothetical protein
MKRNKDEGCQLAKIKDIFCQGLPERQNWPAALL